MSPQVSINILSYNTKDLTRRCLKSIYKYTKNITFEVIVVDNASRDGSIEMIKTEFPQVKLIKNKINKFYAKGNNQAIKNSKGKYVLMLNSDTYFVDNSVKKLIDYMQKNNMYICEGREITEDGKVINTGSRFPNPLVDFYELSLVGRLISNKKKVDEYRMKDQDRNKNFKAEVVCNAFMAVERKLLNKIGGYDEKFTLYYTESDLCKIAKKMGYSSYHFAQAKVIHRVAASTDLLLNDRINIYYSDLKYFYKKNDYKYGNVLFYLLFIEKVLVDICKKIFLV